MRTLPVIGKKRSVADNVSPASDKPYCKNSWDPMNELLTADSRALHEPFSAVLAAQSRNDAFRWITSVLSVQSRNLRSSNSHLVAYTGSDLALNWFESHVGSPVSGHWGDGAALLGAPWPRIVAWLESDGPLAMMALDALIAFRKPAPNMAPLVQIAAPVLAQPPSIFEFEQTVLNALKTHDTPRIKNSVEAVLRNSTEILRGGRRGVAVYDLPMLFLNPEKFPNAAAILDQHTSVISEFRKSMYALIGKSGLK